MTDYQLPEGVFFNEEQFEQAVIDIRAFIDVSFGCYPDSEIETKDGEIIDVIPEIMRLILNRGICAIEIIDSLRGDDE
tara:strand:- start:398 stop:631 length:234 start_codon:yes stop_codon:yes gene_type:complete